MSEEGKKAALAIAEQGMSIEEDTKRYFRAMTSIDGHATCLAIECKYGLDGYPPELVSIGFQAIKEGKDPHGVIDEYVNRP